MLNLITQGHHFLEVIILLLINYKYSPVPPCNLIEKRFSCYFLVNSLLFGKGEIVLNFRAAVQCARNSFHITVQCRKNSPPLIIFIVCQGEMIFLMEDTAYYMRNGSWLFSLPLAVEK